MKLTTKKRLLGFVWATTRLAVAQCEAAVANLTVVDSCLEVELRRPRCPIGESRSSLFEPATRVRRQGGFLRNMNTCAALQEGVFKQEKRNLISKSLADEIQHT